MTSYRYNTITNNKEFDDYISSLGYYINFNKTNLNLNDTLDFCDSQHLNQSGVTKIDPLMIEILKAEFPSLF